MKLNTNVFDLWVFHKQEEAPNYLLLHTSNEKADKWFAGNRFWQIPCDFFQENEPVEAAVRRVLKTYDLKMKALWAVEHAYIFYNRRYKENQLCTVFAAEVDKPAEIELPWEHSEYGWFTYAECQSKLHYRGLIEGLHWTRKYVTEPVELIKELQLI